MPTDSTHRSIAVLAACCVSVVVHAQDASSVVTPPEIVTRVTAVVSPDAIPPEQNIAVVLTVTIDHDGAVDDVVVVESAGLLIDAAAVDAVRQWRFKPAMQGGQPIASRITVSIPFRSASSAPSLPDEGDETAVPVSPIENPHYEATAVVEHERRSEDRAASEFVMPREVLQVAPRQEGADVLRSAPGMYIGRGEGAVVAHSYMLRGFEADHGQDIEFHVGGLPINQPSHVHGQGYADLGFLIGDTVHELHVTEGVYDPQQGDFAIAGSINVDLGVPEADRGVRIETAVGAFGTQRLQLLWAPKGAERETFAALQYSQTDGFGDNRAGEAGSVILQARLGEGAWRYRLLGIAYGARANLAGVVRADDVDSGRVCFSCVYPYPTARAQNGTAGRVMLGAFIDYRGDDGANAQLGAWLGYDTFRLRGNPTGFTQTLTTSEGDQRPGDLAEQQNRVGSLGVHGRYRVDVFHPVPVADVHGALELGFAGRLDTIEQAQHMLDAAAQNRVWDRPIDGSVRGMDVGFWGDLDWQITRHFKARAGVRTDVLGYQVTDQSADRRTAVGVAWGPRTSVEFAPLSFLSLRAAYGEGYRSPQAQLIAEDGRVPFAKVRSADVGAVFDWGAPLRLTVGGYYTRVSDDVSFDGEESRLQSIGATRRFGAVVQAASKPWSWLIGSLSLTVVDAALVDAPVDGSTKRVAFVPPLVARADLGAEHRLLREVGPWELNGRVGTGLSYLAGRPLPTGAFSDPLALLDASAGLRWGPLDLTLEIYNLLDTQYAALMDNFESDWNPSPSSVPSFALHTAAGAPMSWMVTLSASL